MKNTTTTTKPGLGRITALAFLLTLSLSSFAAKANAVSFNPSPFTASTAASNGPRNAAKHSAARDEVNSQVRSSFKKGFANATALNWKVSQEFIKVTFQLNGAILSAFYSHAGDLLAVSRNILTTQLPLSLMLDIHQSYSDYWVNDLFEMTSDQDNTYYLTLQNAAYTLILKSVDNDSWTVYKKMARD